jgi:hypothetical protein
MGMGRICWLTSLSSRKPLDNGTGPENGHSTLNAREKHTAVSPRWELHGKNLTLKLYSLEAKSRESEMQEIGAYTYMAINWAENFKRTDTEQRLESNAPLCGNKAGKAGERNSP